MPAHAGRGLSGFPDFVFQLVHGDSCLMVGLDGFVDLSAGVHDGRVVFPAEFASDFREGGVREFPGQIHGDLSGHDQVAGPPFGFQVGDFFPGPAGDGFLDVRHSDDLYQRFSWLQLLTSYLPFPYLAGEDVKNGSEC